MNFSDWQELRDYAIEQFHDTPHPFAEQEIIDAFTLHPDQVVAAVHDITAEVAAGRVRSGWAVLRVRAGRINTPVANPAYDDSRERERHVQRAEQWVRAAGRHFDRESELVEELFGDFGRLRVYRDDLALSERMVALWRQVRPVGEQIEADSLKRAKAWRTIQKSMQKRETEEVKP